MPFLQRPHFMATNAIFDTGCIGLQSCIEMQPKKCMQPTDKLEFGYISVIFFISSTISLITDDMFFLNIPSNNLLRLVSK